MLLLTITLLGAIAALLYIFLTWNFNYWSKRGVNGPKPNILVGSFPNLFKQQQHLGDDFNDIYKKYKNTDNYIGVHMLRMPQLMILEPSLVHDVFVTAFKNFSDNEAGVHMNSKKDPLVGNNPFILTGQRWKEQRALVSPGLTGSRIKVAYEVMQQVCHKLCDYIEEEMSMGPKDGINGKDLALRFTSENVCDSVLGIKVHSFTKNPIPVVKYSKQLTEENTVFFIYILFVGLCPSIMKFFIPKFFPKDCENFFLDLMKKAFSLRSESKVDRQDFMNHLLSLKAKGKATDIELASHSMTFLLDGLDTTAAVISHTLLLLAKYPETQEILRKEILSNLDENRELSFEKLSELPYLNACIYETLRIFPPGLWSAKVCTEPYEFTNKNGAKLQVEPGLTILLPTYAIHNDPEFYPEPKKFKPERFLLENGEGHKKLQDMGRFIGFGDGPRQCLGMRFALTQTKAAISSIIKNFNVKPNPKTIAEPRLDPKQFVALQDGGVWLDFEKRI